MGTTNEENKTKICYKCKKEKSFNEFSDHKKSNDGKYSYCKKCAAEYAKARYDSKKAAKRHKERMENEPEFREKRRKYNLTENSKISKKKYDKSEQGKRKRIELTKKLKEEGKISAYNRKYYQSDKGKEASKRSNDARLSTPEGKLRAGVSARLGEEMHKCIEIPDYDSKLEFLDYTIQELFVHLEKFFLPGMTRKNYGTIWSLDHVIALSRFPVKIVGDSEFKKCWSLNNLQPMFSRDNMSKGDSDFLEWLEKNPDKKDLYWDNYLYFLAALVA